MVTAVYGATFSIAKEIMPEYGGPFGIIFIRVTVAFVLFFIWHKLFVQEKVSGWRDFGLLFLCACFGVAGNMLLFFKGLSLTHPVNASLMMTVSPVFVLVFAALLRYEKLTLIKLTGIILGATGAAMIIGGPRLEGDVGNRLGDLLVLLNASSYALYLVIVKPLMQKYQPITVVHWTFFFGSLIVIPFGWQEFTEIRWDSMPPAIWFALAFVVIGTTFLAYLLNAWALGRTRSSVVGSYIFLQPVLATVFAVFFAGYGLSLDHLVYSVLIFAGVYLVSR